MTHHPVLLHEAIEALSIKSGGCYIDATAGEGGHLEEITKRGGKVLAIDWDKKQIENLKSKIKSSESIIFDCGNFSDIEDKAKRNGFYPVDGILFDLGLSMRQIKESNRGFSYNNLDEPLDMRLSGEISTTAAELVNSCSENELYEIFATNSEEINSRTIARAIVRARSLKPILTTGELVEIISQSMKSKSNKTVARIFQALRMAVNNELDNLKKALEGALKIVKPEGKIAVITFHSIEDRLVKRFITINHLKTNKIKKRRSFSFERSAKLRVFSQIGL